MPATIEPEPAEDEREAILAALAVSAASGSGWAEVALAEAVEGGESDP